MSLLPQTIDLSSLDSLVVVESLYNGILNRNGDNAGLDFWVSKLESGAVTVDNVAEAMFASPEAVDLYAGSTRTDIVETLYHQILGRASDADGKTFYVDSNLSLADIAQSILLSPEAVLHNGAALLGFQAAAVTGANFDGTGTLEDFAPVPPAHHVTFSTELGGVPTGTLKADGTFDSGAGTANNGFYSVVDHDESTVLSIRSHERQSAGSDQAVSITETAPGHVVYEFDVHAGSQNSPGGVNPNRGDASLDFQVSKFLLSDPDHVVHFEFKSAIGTANEKDISGNLVAVDDHTFQVVSSGTPGLADGTVLIGDFNPSSDHISNSTNLGFGVFAGNPNVPAGDYSFEISVIDTTGANAGHEVSSITALMHATAGSVQVPVANFDGIAVSPVHDVAFQDVVSTSLLPQTIDLSSLDSLVVVESLYNGILNRNGDNAGLDFWVSKLESGAVTVDNVAEAMFASPEAVDLYAGSTRTDIVETLYHQILGRASDTDGKTFYVDSNLSLADIAQSILLSPEAVLHNGAALLGFQAAAVTGANFDGTGTLEDFAPVPPAHHVTFSTELGGVPTGTLKADGTFDSGAGTANNGFYSVVDHDESTVLSIRSHERQSAGSDQAVSITETAPGHVVYEFDVHAGSQNSPGGVNPNRGDASLDFQVSKFLLSDPDHVVHFEFKSAIGTANEKDISGNLVAVDDHTFQVVSSGTPGLADGTVLIGDFNPSSDHISNSTNLGFGVFAGNPNVPAGDYSFEISVIDTTGANAGHEVSSITALMHATAEPVQLIGLIDHPMA